MVTNLIVATLIGGFMGLLTHANRNNGIKKPRNNKLTFNPGFLKDMAFGAIAAVAAVAYTEPSGIGKLIVISVAAGYAGEGFIAKLEVNRIQHISNNDNVIDEQLDSEVKPDKPKPKRDR